MNLRMETEEVREVTDTSKAAEILQNVIIGLTVSFVALSLGAALGMNSTGS